MDAQQLDYLKSLKLRAFKTDIYFAMNAPTWVFKDNGKLETYLPDFELDEGGAMRDFAAIPTNGATPFFKDPKVLDVMAIPGMICPIDDNLHIDPSFKPIPGFRYFFAGDLSVSGDSTGIALVHFDPFTNKVTLDFSKCIKAESSNHVDYAPIRQLIFNLSDIGFNICGVAFDQFQSNDSINILNQRGYNARVVKYSESFAGCNMLHDLITSGRFIYGDCCDVFIGEAKELQVVNSKRIDHMMSEGFYNSKDCWDSVVNATVICINDYYESSRNVELANKFAEITKNYAAHNRTRKLDDDLWFL